MDRTITVDTRWPYRAGYPRLLRPSVRSEYIVNKDANPITEAKFEELKSRINTIMDAHNIPRGPNPPAVMYRAQKFGTSMLPRVIVDCIYDKETSHSKMWAKAVTEIYAAAKMVAEEGREFGVELFDWRYAGTSHICTPPDSESRELKANWDEGHGYRRQILQLFENRPVMFQAMIPVGRYAAGQRAYEWTTVILFDAINAEDVTWDFLEERMRSFLPANIDIEIRQRAGPLFCNGNFGVVEREQLAMDEYIRPPRPGCDISQRNNLSAGTMGGYVITEATDSKQRTTFGVTNAHIALASYEEPSLNTPPAGGISAQSPCERTRRADETQLLNDIAATEKRIQAQLDIIDAVKETEPELSQKLEKSLETNKSELASLRKDLQLVQRDPSIGSVCYAKLGRRDYTTPSLHTDKLMMDLALIKMDCLAGKKPQEIYWPENRRNPRIRKNTTCNFWEVDSLGGSQDAEEHIRVVARLSRSGVYTRGIVSEFKAETFPFEQNGQKVSRQVEAWAITCPRRHESADTPFYQYRDVFPFVRGGDSGSFVIAAADWEYDGYDNKIMKASKEAITDTTHSDMPFIVGLLYGLNEDGDVGYFIPFDAVKEEIESMTGEKMVWPQKRSESLLAWERGYVDNGE